LFAPIDNNIIIAYPFKILAILLLGCSILINPSLLVVLDVFKHHITKFALRDMFTIHACTTLFPKAQSVLRLEALLKIRNEISNSDNH